MPDSMSLIYIAPERHFSDHNGKGYLVMQLFMLLSGSVGIYENCQAKLWDVRKQMNSVYHPTKSAFPKMTCYISLFQKQHDQ